MKYHYQVCSYLKDMEDKHLIELGGALGLSYTKLTRMNHLPAEMIAAWLRAEDDVQVTSGPPSWDGLVKALRDIGQAGIASKFKIERENRDTHSACKSARSSTLIWMFSIMCRKSVCMYMCCVCVCVFVGSYSETAK